MPFAPTTNPLHPLSRLGLILLNKEGGGEVEGCLLKQLYFGLATQISKNNSIRGIAPRIRKCCSVKYFVGCRVLGVLEDSRIDLGSLLLYSLAVLVSGRLREPWEGCSLDEGFQT